ncbi:hypothetical protein NQ318_000728 [Aromia moschata]|uniref:Uncharacterized protein n=1 Tax=Aromia moschata TaxID=1265417 RepID=A0AAV8X2S9_9CUCU|nr:hypothetical protein NQ318_000728 [Aromia moschata]
MFLNKVLFTDKATFTRSGVFNFRNKHAWDLENPQLDGAPAHFSRLVRQYLNTTFPDRWIGRGSQMPWPVRSPDFNPLDFCAWGYMKSLVYEHEINTREELWQKINNAAVPLRNEQLFFKIRRSFNKRVHKCIEVNGHHFEHLLRKVDLFVY